MHRGQSLIVWAIAEGRKAAVSINRYLKTDKPGSGLEN
jgi:NADPH-dependent glutamate synthase beta subunit-like oxidoreductase